MEYDYTSTDYHQNKPGHYILILQLYFLQRSGGISPEKSIQLGRLRERCKLPQRVRAEPGR